MAKNLDARMQARFEASRAAKKAPTIAEAAGLTEVKATRPKRKAKVEKTETVNPWWSTWLSSSLSSSLSSTTSTTPWIYSTSPTTTSGSSTYTPYSYSIAWPHMHINVFACHWDGSHLVLDRYDIDDNCTCTTRPAAKNLTWGRGSSGESELWVNP